MISEENDTSLKYPESHFEYFSQSYVKWFKHDSTLKTKWFFGGNYDASLYTFWKQFIVSHCRNPGK